MLFMFPLKHLLYASIRDPTCLSQAVASWLKCPLNFWFRLRFGDISPDTFLVRRRPLVSCNGSPGINLLFSMTLKKSGYSPRRIRLDTFPELAYSISLWPVVFDKATYILLEFIVSLAHNFFKITLLLKTKLRAFLVLTCFKTDEFGAFRVKFGRFFCYLRISTKSFDAVNTWSVKENRHYISTAMITINSGFCSTFLITVWGFLCDCR